MPRNNPGMTELEFMTQSGPDNSFLTPDTLSRRQILICSEISNGTFEAVKEAYDALIEDNATDPIHVVLGSPGGDLASTLGIMNLLLLSPTPIYTYLMGETCSGGALIYLAGHKRFAANTNLVSLMLHPIGWEKEGNHGEQSALIDYMDSMKTKIRLFIGSRTKIPNELLTELGSHKTKYFVGNELFMFGIATDELTTSAFWVAQKPKPKKATKSSKTKLTQLTD